MRTTKLTVPVKRSYGAFGLIRRWRRVESVPRPWTLALLTIRFPTCVRDKRQLRRARPVRRVFGSGAFLQWGALDFWSEWATEVIRLWGMVGDCGFSFCFGEMRYLIRVLRFPFTFSKIRCLILVSCYFIE